jgi:hypothetical protein
MLNFQNLQKRHPSTSLSRASLIGTFFPLTHDLPACLLLLFHSCSQISCVTPFACEEICISWRWKTVQELHISKVLHIAMPMPVACFFLCKANCIISAIGNGTCSHTMRSIPPSKFPKDEPSIIFLTNACLVNCTLVVHMDICDMYTCNM